MDDIQIQSLVFPIFASLLLLWSITKWFYNGNKNLPPSPPKLPILGNLHQLGPLLHHSLHSLARKHGPLMLLHLGSVPVLIVSSADTACEIVKTHDLTFASRPIHKVHNKLLYGAKDVAFAPYGEYWRQMKSVFVLHLLSSERVQSFRSIREEEVAVLMKKISDSAAGVVNLSKMISEFINDGICRSAFGRKYSDSEGGKKFLQLLPEIAEVMGTVGIGDYIPWLNFVDFVTGFDQKVNRVAKEVDGVLECLIEERLEGEKKESFKDKNGENFLDIMLQIYTNKDADVSLDRNSIKALLLDVLAAGTDSSSTALEWAMAELLRNPAVTQKLQKEVRGIVKEKQDITEEDLKKMTYLKAVIKETLRRHPPVPFLARVASKDVKVKEYDVSAGTMVLVNTWAIARDPVSWDEPEKFKPERFLNSTVDFKGLDFEFLPFGAGRRGCPGMAFSVATIELVLANLVQKFNWELPDGAEGKDLDMSESSGVTVHRGVPLLAVASSS